MQVKVLEKGLSECQRYLIIPLINLEIVQKL